MKIPKGKTSHSEGRGGGERRNSRPATHADVFGRQEEALLALLALPPHRAVLAEAAHGRLQGTVLDALERLHSHNAALHTAATRSREDGRPSANATGRGRGQGQNGREQLPLYRPPSQVFYFRQCLVVSCTLSTCAQLKHGGMNGGMHEARAGRSNDMPFSFC